MNRSNQPAIFAYPRLSRTDLLFIRIGGNGLGNLLCTWARCLTASDRNGWRMIWPTWRSFKPKNWRVNPHDHRTYSDLFRPTDRYLHGWRKPWCLARYRRVPEKLALVNGAPPGSVVEFRGMEDKIAPFVADHERVYGELLKIARPRHLAAFSDPDPAPIGIHVRRGDFVQQATYLEMVNIDNSLLPLEWYMDALRAIRRARGFVRATPCAHTTQVVPPDRAGVGQLFAGHAQAVPGPSVICSRQITVLQRAAPPLPVAARFPIPFAPTPGNAGPWRASRRAG